MSKYNNSLNQSASLLCKCGRRGTIAEDIAGIWTGRSFECPDCLYRKLTKPLTSAEYYEQFTHV